MDTQGFRQFLKEINLPEERINHHILIISELEEFIEPMPSKSFQPPGSNETLEFISYLKSAGKDTFENILALVRYGRYSKNKPLFLTALQFIDGCEVMDNLYNKLAGVSGEKIRNQVFREIELPTAGTPIEERPEIMKTVFGRMESLIDVGTIESILEGSLRTLPEEWYQEGKQKYKQCKDLDEFLDLKSEEFIADLEKIKNEGGFFFNQEITDEVITFVRSQPEIARGVREGNILYSVKMPYMTKEYLTEQDETQKRYYACHCPWVRGAIASGAETISPRFCQCSAGYEKKPWEIIFEQPLKAEVIETVLNGDLRCKFAIHLPDNA